MDRGVGKRMGNCISPCGNLVFSGSQDGAVYVWDTDTGVEKHIYITPLGENIDKKPIHAISFHPMDHIVVFGALGSELPALVFQYHKEEEEK